MESWLTTKAPKQMEPPLTILPPGPRRNARATAIGQYRSPDPEDTFPPNKQDDRSSAAAASRPDPGMVRDISPPVL